LQAYINEDLSHQKLLKMNLNKINWEFLSKNPKAINLLKENPDKINWYALSTNPGMIEMFDDINFKDLNKDELIEYLIKIKYIDDDYEAFHTLHEQSFDDYDAMFFERPYIRNEYPENEKIYKIYCEDNPSLVLSIGLLISNHARKTRSIICEPISDSKTQEWKCISKNNQLCFTNNLYPNMCLDKYYGTKNLSEKRMVLYKINNTKAQMFTYSLESGLIKTCNGYLSITDNQVFSTPSSTQKFIFKRVIVQPPSA
jgi:hypothetical protein